MPNTTIDEDGKEESKTTRSREENVNPADRKKKNISVVEIGDFLQIRRDSRRQSQRKRHSSLVADRRDSKPYSIKCNLTNPSVNVLLPNSLGSERILNRRCPSVNIGVRSMNLEAISGEVLCEFETVAFAEVIKEATYALEVLERTFHQKYELDKKEPERVVVRRQGCCFQADDRFMYFGPDAGYSPVVPSVWDKLLANREVAYNVLTKVACQLEKNGSYDWLKCEINGIIEDREKKCSLSVNLKIWKDLVERLQTSLQQFEGDFGVQKKEYSEEIERLLREIDASFCANNDKLVYIKRWEASKLEQQNLRQSMEEKALLVKIKELQKFRKTETKVNNELQAYLTHAINNAEAEILAWTARYNDEMEKRQLEMTDLKEKIEELEKFMEDSRELQATRQITIDEYLAEQQVVKDEKYYWETVHKCATKIQALWRGYMVRHRIGRYRHVFDKNALMKKKKGAKGKKGKKKPKKK